MPLNSLPPSELTREAIVRRKIAPSLGIEQWSDARKVALVSALTTPFALAWVVRTEMVQDDPTLSPYVNREFLPVLLPFLWAQLVGHVTLSLVGYALRNQPAKTPWLVHVEAQLWCACLAFSLYAVGTFTHGFIVLLLAVPVVGYLLFDTRPVHFGMVTLSIGVALGVVLPAAGVAPYAPFLAHAPFDEGQLEPMWILSVGFPSLFAAVVGVVVQVQLVRRLRERQSELEWLSSTDALTDLWNRAAFFARLEEEIARTRRHEMPLSLLMIDVDHFKKVNDTHGHAVGDQVLRDLARRIRETLRGGDVAARYGGEELAVMLPQTSLERAEGVAQRLLAVARTIRLGDAPITVSIGVATLAPTEDGDGMVARADEALYTAKNEGRDRAVTAAAPPIDVSSLGALYDRIRGGGTDGRRSRDEEEITSR